MLKNGRPYHLPQVNAPYLMVLEKLNEEGIGYETLRIQPSDDDGIEPSQKVVYSDEVENCSLGDDKPIWIAGNDNVSICDGHHRYFKALFTGKPLIAVKLDLNFMDACRILNKIQDIYDYEQSRSLEEVEGQGAINYYGGDENQFLSDLEESNNEIQQEIPSANEQTIIAYRKEPIRENSAVGNFFTLQPVDGYAKYQIEFNNLLDTHVLGMTYKDGQQPAEILAKIWFPHVNFEKLGEQYNMPPINLKNKAVAQKAMKMGFDGIKYGDTLIQGLK